LKHFPLAVRSPVAMVLILFATTLFLSAALLFLVEPMFAKMALPALGGSAAVWNTCMVFFQAGLLAGYAYAHGVTKRLGARWQVAAHAALLFVPLAVLPVGVSASQALTAGVNPVSSLLWMLLVSVGLPFFVLSTITPTLQVWYAQTGHEYAKDPYFLYGASNLGSMTALLSYPILIEPHLRLIDQGRLWAYGYGLLMMLTWCCGFLVWRSLAVRTPNPGPPAQDDSRGDPSPGDNPAMPTGRQRMRWVALSFVPSSLMLGVTTVLTTDLPPIPLFWVVPLAIYLLTFILVFARKPLVSHEFMIHRLPVLLVAATIPIVTRADLALWMTILLDLLALFVAAMVCHGELAKSRPSSVHLTEFYLWISVGGLLGGVFNGLVAPLIFNRVAEYPLALVLVAFLRPTPSPQESRPSARALDFGLPLALGGILAAAVWGLQDRGLNQSALFLLLGYGPAVLLCLSFAKRPVRFGLGLAAVLLASATHSGPYGRVSHIERSFFGVYRVSLDREEKFRRLIHGSTIHGMQSLDPARSLEPLVYYSRTGPIGQLFAALTGTDTGRRVAIVGLGTGSMACYGEPGQEFTFYEIDPAVERFARDPKYFTFLRDCAPKIKVVLGDARLSLKNARDRQYDLIVLDAFSSDAIPLHLLTREAMKLYLAKLSDTGILAFNISNRFLDLHPVLANLARDAGLACYGEDDLQISENDQQDGKFSSSWVVMARRGSDLGKLLQDARWTALPGRLGTQVWADDFSNILGVIRWY